MAGGGEQNNAAPGAPGAPMEFQPERVYSPEKQILEIPDDARRDVNKAVQYLYTVMDHFFQGDTSSNLLSRGKIVGFAARLREECKKDPKFDIGNFLNVARQNIEDMVDARKRIEEEQTTASSGTDVVSHAMEGLEHMQRPRDPSHFDAESSERAEAYVDMVRTWFDPRDYDALDTINRISGMVHDFGTTPAARALLLEGLQQAAIDLLHRPVPKQDFIARNSEGEGEI